MQQPRVSIIVLSWNSLARVQACLAGIRSLDYGNFETIIIDNGSTDGSVDWLAGLGGGVILMRNIENRGYAGGCNQGLRAALANGADYVWLLNSDAIMVPDTLARLAAIAEADPAIGLLSPLITRSDDPSRCEFAGAKIDFDNGYWEAMVDPRAGRQWQDAHPDRFLLSGTALLIRRTVPERIGLLDERFFAYFEDLDYSLRGLKAGFLTRMAFDVPVMHDPKGMHGIRTLDRPHYHYLMARNEILFWRKYLGVIGGLRPAWRLWLRETAFLRQLDDRPDIQQALCAGLWDGLIGHGGSYDPARQMPRLIRALAM